MRRIVIIFFMFMVAITLSSCDLFDLFVKDSIEPPEWIIGKWEDIDANWDWSFSNDSVNIEKIEYFKDYYDSATEYRIESKPGASSFAYTKYVFKKVDEDKLLFSYVVGISSENNIELLRKE